MTIDQGAAPATRRSLRKQGRYVSVVGVAGELLVTAGVLVLLFLGWQLWLNDVIVGAQQNEVAAEISSGWSEPSLDRPDSPGPAEPTVATEPVVPGPQANASTFAVLIVPRWGADYERTIAEGVGMDVLNHLQIGHYPETQMPGEVGNFSLAAHRTTRGAAFQNVHELRVGDHIYVETQDGWHSYVFRSIEYVLPTGVGVIEPVPQQPGAEATDRFITLTTCNPIYSAAERLIAYGVYDKWYPRENGAPSEIAETVAARNS